MNEMDTIQVVQPTEFFNQQFRYIMYLFVDIIQRWPLRV